MQTADKKIPFTLIEAQAWLWLGIPVVIFLFGWMQTWIAAIATAGLAAAALLTARAEREARTDGGRSIDGSAWHDVELTPGFGVTLALLTLLAVGAGSGGYVMQHYDHAWRNAVLYDLATETWPVTYADGSDGQPRMLCYYLAYWLPSALVGAGAGNIRPAYPFLLLWTVWGIAIAYSLLVSRAGGRQRWWMPVVLVAFGCLDAILGYYIYTGEISRLLSTDMNENGVAYMTFPFFAQIEMIFNQALPCWVALPLIYRLRRRPGLSVAPCALLFPFAPLPCIGISAAVIWCLIRGGRESLSVANIASLPALAVTGLFFMCNNNAAATAANPQHSWWQVAVTGLIFAVTAYAIWIPLIWPQIRRNSIFLILFTTSMLLPFVALGDSPDLGHRATIPITMMMTYAVELETGRWRRLSRWRRIAIPAALAIGLIPTIYLASRILNRHINARANGIDPRPTYINGRLDDPERNIYYNNFVAEGDNFYRRYLMRRHDDSDE